jgi:hypothetical protein
MCPNPWSMLLRPMSKQENQELWEGSKVEISSQDLIQGSFCALRTAVLCSPLTRMLHRPSVRDFIHYWWTGITTPCLGKRIWMVEWGADQRQSISQYSLSTVLNNVDTKCVCRNWDCYWDLYQILERRSISCLTTPYQGRTDDCTVMGAIPRLSP